MNRKYRGLLSITCLAIFGILIMGAIPAVQGASSIKRPLDDWFYDVFGYDLNPNVGGWVDGYQVRPQGIDYNMTTDEWIYQPIWECTYDGFILDRDMHDGRHMITVNINVKNAPVIVAPPFGSGGYYWVFQGFMDYKYQYNFIIDIEVWAGWLIMLGFDDDGFDEYGNILLPRWDLPMVYGSVFGFEFISVHFHGDGEGTIVNYWDESWVGNGDRIWEPGESAKLSTNMVGLVKDDFKLDHPNYWPSEYSGLPWSVLWAVDFVKLH
ncbi:MAG: hypothetical protein ACFFBH_07315 [Promethearchaeota archaeon]